MPVHFYIDKHQDRRGQGAIRMSAIVCGARLMTSTGLKIQPAKWDTRRQRVRQGASNADGVTYAVLNAALSRFADRFATYESDCIMKGHKPTRQDLAKAFADIAPLRATSKARHVETAPSHAQDVCKCISLFLKEEGEARQFADNTRKGYKCLYANFQKFKKGMTFADLDTRGLACFVEFLREKRGARNQTIFNTLGTLRSFMRWATEKGYNKNTDFLKFRPRLKMAKNPVVFLEWGELMRLYHMETPKDGETITLKDKDGKEYGKTVKGDYYERARDVFCFCCFTSLRISDANGLKKSDIDRKRGTLSITTKKTSTAITIELNKYAVAILDKYKKFDLHFALPYLPENCLCRYIKELCQLCRMDKPITKTYYRGAKRIDETRPKWAWIATHTGRRTFICNALMLGIPPLIVMKWTGHSNYSSMQPYIDVADTAKAEAMQKFNEL